MKKYWIITYGCQMNKSDSERIASTLETMEYSPASTRRLRRGGPASIINEADLIVVNMCSVRQSAVDRVYGNIKNFDKLKKKNKKLKTLLTGCITKYDLKKFKDHFNHILSIKSLPYWKNFLKKDKCFYYPTMLGSRTSLRKSDFFKSDCAYLKTKPKYTTKFSAYIPVVIGCNNFCSYCVVPYTRGPEISRPAEDIVKEAKRLIKKGYKEIWLLGENVNSYSSSKVNFSKLLKMINDIPGDFWLRFTSSHPKDFSDELIKTIAKGKKVTKYISLPIQSGDDEILKKMNRPYTVRDYKNLVKKIRQKIPNVCLSTDVIVGFPGETKKQFQNTVKLFKEIKFDMAYIAQYSLRPGTAAAKMEDTVSHQEKERRDKVLTEVLKKTALENNKKYIGKVVEVLPASTRPRVGRGGSEYERKDWLIGKTKEYKTIKFKGNKNLIGKFVKVKVTNVIPWGLKGELFSKS